LSLNSSVHIPSGFPMANGQNACDFHAGEFKGRCETFFLLTDKQHIQNRAK